MLFAIVLLFIAGMCALRLFRRAVPVLPSIDLSQIASEITNVEETTTNIRGPRPTLGLWTDAFSRLIPATDKGYEKLTTELTQAGYYHPQSVSNFLATRNAAILAWIVFAVAMLALELAGPLTTQSVCVLIGGIAMIYGLPRVILSSLATSRAQRIEHDLPDALDMMTMMMSGGLTMESALQRVIGEFNDSHPAMAMELAIVARQSEAGTFDKAMIAFARRLNLPDVTTLATLLRRGNRLGGRISDSLREYSDSMRRIRHQKAEERGNKSSVKLLLPVVFCLAPPIYILLLGPAVLELRTFITRENRPGGILAPSVQEAGMPQMPRAARR